MSHQAEKDALYDGFAEVAKALTSGRRAEIVDLLSQGERPVEDVTAEIGQSVTMTDPTSTSMTDPLTQPVASIGLVLDCTDPELLARFWSAALGYTIAGRAGRYVALIDPTRGGPKLLLQQVPEAKTSKNRMHLDIDTRHVDDEVRRLCATGAMRIDPAAHCEHGTRWVVLADPEGNEFCVCDGGRPAP